jgi:PAS domain S-box-containing protein
VDAARTGTRARAKRCSETESSPERGPESLGAILRAWTATLDAIEDFISVHDWDFRIVRANRALARHLGCEPAHLVGQRCHWVFHGTEEPWPGCPHDRARQTETTATEEILDSCLGVPLQVRCSPYCDEAGRAVGTVHVARDITQERRRDAEREALIARLQEALAQAKILGGLLPICSSCKRIRDDQGYWNQIEAYIGERSHAEFTHGICPECAQELYPQWVGLRRSPSPR